MRILRAEVINSGGIEKTEEFVALKLLGAPPEFVVYSSPVLVHIKANKTLNADIHIQGRASATFKLNCARCLEPFDKELKVEFNRIVSEQDAVIDLATDIRESMLVEIPFQAICKPDCKGLCASCGQNKNWNKCNCVASEKPPARGTFSKFRFQ